MQELAINLNDVQLAIDGDKEVLENILNTLKNQLFNIALAILKNKQDAEDALQETYLKAFKNIHKIKHKQFFATWVTRVLINNARTIQKKNRRYLLQENISTIYNTPLNENELLIKDLLDRLQEKERMIIYLKFYGGFEISSIAKILRCPESTVKSRLYRGLNRLRKEFDESNEK